MTACAASIHEWFRPSASLPAQSSVQQTIQPSTIQPSTIAAANAPPVNTILRLHEVFENFQAEIRKMEAMPTCQKSAANILANSCQFFDMKDHPNEVKDTEDALDISRKLFAVRMTNCELVSARQSMPSACRPLLDVDGEVAISEARLYMQDCLEGIAEAGTNPWTTYNSMKTNGLILCQSMRHAMDKDDDTRTFKTMMALMKDMNLNVAINAEEFEKVKETFKGFSNQTQEFYIHIRKENQELKEMMKSSVEGLRDNMTVIGAELQAITTSMSEVKTNFGAYSNEVAKIVDDASSLNTTMHSEIAVILDIIREDMGDARDAFEYLLELNMADLHKLVYNATDSVMVANQAVANISEAMIALSSGMDAPLKKLVDLNVQADTLHEKQQGLADEIDTTADLVKQDLGEIHELVKCLSKSIQSLTNFLQGKAKAAGFWLAGFAFYAYPVARMTSNAVLTVTPFAPNVMASFAGVATGMGKFSCTMTS